MTRVRWSKLKLKGFVSAKGSHIKVTQFSAIARFVFCSVSSIGGAVLFGVIVKFGSEILLLLITEALGVVVATVAIRLFFKRVKRQ